MAAAEAADRVELDGWYTADKAVEEVTNRDLEKFMDLAAQYHAVPALRSSQYAKLIFNEGYQNPHLMLTVEKRRRTCQLVTSRKHLSRVGFMALMKIQDTSRC